MNTVRLPATIENLDSFCGFVSSFLRANGFPGERIREIEMAVEEIVVNVTRYAYPEGEQGALEIRARAASGDDVILEFEDHGAPFDPTSLPPPDLNPSVSDREVGGLGVFLVRRMVNEVRYRREGDRNILTLFVRKNRGKA